MLHTYFQFFLLSWALGALLMLILWLIHLSIKNAGIVDVGWALGIALSSILYFVLGDGFSTRKWLGTLMACAWGFRLGLYILFARVIGHAEDARYTALKNMWKEKANFNLFFFFQLQGFLIAVFSLPFLFSSLSQMPRISFIEWMGVGLWGMGILGERTADQELHTFKRNPASKGKTCRVGLWKYSRHPNYFFEWLTWCGFALFALASPLGWIAIVCPVLILHFLLKVTGIPATEAQALKTKGDDYREYQRTTSAFIPWFPKRSQ